MESPAFSEVLRKRRETSSIAIGYTLQKDFWHTLSDDGYVLEHLSDHMERAGRPEDLFALITENNEHGRNGWFETRERCGQLAGYLNDVSRASSNARALWIESNRDDTMVNRNLSRFIYCKLIELSIAAHAASIPEELLSIAMKHGFLTKNHVVAIIKWIPEPQERFRAINAIVPFLPELLPMAEATAYAIKDYVGRALALTVLAPTKPELFSEALAAARMIEDDDARAGVLAAMAPCLPETLISEAATMAHGENSVRDNKKARARALAAIASRRSALFPEVFATARSIESDLEHADVLAAIAPKLPASLVPDILREIDLIRDNDAHIRALSAIAPRQPKLFHDVLKGALETKSDCCRADVLSTIASTLPLPLIPEALSVAFMTLDHYYQTLSLAAIAPRLSASELFDARDEIAKVEKKLLHGSS